MQISLILEFVIMPIVLSLLQAFAGCEKSSLLKWWIDITAMQKRTHRLKRAPEQRARCAKNMIFTQWKYTWNFYLLHKRIMPYTPAVIPDEPIFLVRLSDPPSASGTIVMLTLWHLLHFVTRQIYLVQVSCTIKGIHPFPRQDLWCGLTFVAKQI